MSTKNRLIASAGALRVSIEDWLALNVRETKGFSYDVMWEALSQYKELEKQYAEKCRTYITKEILVKNGFEEYGGFFEYRDLWLEWHDDWCKWEEVELNNVADLEDAMALLGYDIEIDLNE